MNGLLSTAAAIFLALAQTLLNGWATSVLWNWYIPSFTGFSEMNFLTGAGVSLLASLFVPVVITEKEEAIDALGIVFLRPFLAVGIGFVFLQCM